MHLRHVCLRGREARASRSFRKRLCSPEQARSLRRVGFFTFSPFVSVSFAERNKTTNRCSTTKSCSHLIHGDIHVAQTVHAINERILSSTHDQTCTGVFLPHFLPHNKGEVCLTNDELKAAPPHRAELNVARHPARSTGGAHESDITPVSPNPRVRKTRTKRGTGNHPGGMGTSGTPTILALAVQVSWPEDSGTVEGKLARNLQNEQGVLSTRVEALKVGQSTKTAAARYGLVRVRAVISTVVRECGRVVDSEEIVHEKMRSIEGRDESILSVRATGQEIDLHHDAFPAATLSTSTAFTV